MTSPTPSISSRYPAEMVEEFYRQGFWQRATLGELVEQRATTTPDAPFISDSTSALTYGALRDRAFGLAAGLRRGGLLAGDRVAVQLPNWTDFAVVMVAAARIGAVTVPVMPIFRHDEVRYILEHSGARVAVTPGEFRGFDYAAMYREIRAGLPELHSVVVARGDPGHDDSLDGLVVPGTPEALADELGPGPGPDDGHITIYTSGTTSRPKGCYHTWNTALFSARMMAEQLDCTGSDVAFGPSPVTHSTGYITSVLIPLIVGASSHLMEVWEPAEALQRIEQHRCTYAVTATAFLQMLLAVHRPEEHDPATIRFWVAAGAPIPASVVEDARRMFRGAKILSLYGRSENFVTTMCTIDDAEERSTSSDGCAQSGVDIAVVGSDGRELPRGEEGDIAYRGPGHMIEYFGDPAETTALFTADGHSRSGDLGRMDGDGYVRVTGRLKDIIIRGGQNISAREIEEHLLLHPGVANVAVVAMPDPRLGERACAYVVPAPGVTGLSLEDVVTFLKERRIAVQKLPERLEVVEALPMTATGKIQKHVLRADVAGKLESEAAPDPTR
ncbi:MAG TPA: AMP-binding protein [Acidimicrobiia bacterium]|nr:AMP-binding protein [Acidimicrobiia bacterium]